jgi:hypothetical protein
MKHNKTTIGGLLSSIGKSITGAGILAQLTQIMPTSNVIPPGILAACWWLTLAGVVMGVIGTALTAWFAADASAVNNVAASVQTVAVAVDQINKGGTDFMAKPVAEQSPVDPAKPI